MKNIKLLIIAFIIHGTVQAQSTGTNFNFLKNYNGRYPYDVKLMKNLQIKKALVGLLGRRYKFFKDNFSVEVPIEVNDGIFVAKACQAHNCGDTNFIIVVDIANKKVYAGMREDTKVTTYPANAAYPQAISDWIANN